MSQEKPQPSTTVAPITSIDDPRVLTLLSTEHWSLLQASVTARFPTPEAAAITQDSE